MSTHLISPLPSQPLDLDGLYRTLAPRLERIVRRDVHAGEAVIEDACQFAWSRLACHSGRVRRESVLSWLATTAIHEAFRLIRRDRRELSLEGDDEARGVADTVAAIGPGPEELVEQRLRLAALARLSPRQQRMLWLHAVGLSYGEIALSTGATTRTVERQLLRAKRTARQW
ncbi:MAG: sigma-70 family RNA polymerase sigma factor [Actinomycetota bacterium]|nr:sigma-70 family RNA polymerase sigma factor [Actinomycetota bacterium]